MEMGRISMGIIYQKSDRIRRKVMTAPLNTKALDVITIETTQAEHLASETSSPDALPPSFLEGTTAHTRSYVGIVVSVLMAIVSFIVIGSLGLALFR
jgi:hypothetical protein